MSWSEMIGTDLSHAARRDERSERLNGLFRETVMQVDIYWAERR